MTTYAILGGGGVFGIHAARFILAQPSTERVISIGRNPVKPEAFALTHGVPIEKYEYRQAHICFEPDRVFELLDESSPDVIVNIAAQGEGAVSWKNSWRYFDTNATALARITEHLMDKDYLKRWIQIGTSELYGSVNSPANEQARLVPTSPYAASKAAADMHLLAIHKTLGFPVNILRPSNAYGPGQLLHRIIPRAVVCGLSGRKLPLHGGGAARKSYIHATDLARAIHLVATAAPLGTVYNVGPKEPVTIREIVEIIAAELGMKFEDLCDMTPARFGEDSQYWLDSSAIRELGWKPTINLREGIRDMIQWGKLNLGALMKAPQTYEFHA